MTDSRKEAGRENEPESREARANPEETLEQPPQHHIRRRSWLFGITAAAVLLTWWAWSYLQFTNYSGLVVSRDLQVVRVLGDGPALRSGIRPGDHVRSIDGRPTRNLTDYLLTIQDPAIKGREVAVQVQRGGEDLAFPLRIARYPVFTATSFGPILGVTLLIFGVFVHLRQRDDPASGLYLLLIVCLFVLLGLSSHLLKQTASPLLHLLWGTALIACVPLNLHFYLVFPEAKALVRERPRILAGLYALPALLFVLLASAVVRIEWCLHRGLDSGPPYSLLRYVFLACFLVGVLSCPVFVGSLVHSFLTASSAERRKQVQIVLIGAVTTLFLAAGAVLGLGRLLMDPEAAALWPPWTFDAVYGLAVLATVLLPLAMAVAILKHRLWEIERTIHGSLRYLILSSLFILLYFVILGLLTRTVGEVVRPASHLPFLIFALTAAVIGEPLRRFVDRTVDRVFDPEADLHRVTLGAFSHEIATIRHLEPLSSSLCENASKLTAARQAAVVLKAEPSWRLVASPGFAEEAKPRLLEGGHAIERLSRRGPPGTPSLLLRNLPALEEGIGTLLEAGVELAVPVLHQGRFLGCLFLGPKSDGSPFDAEDRRTLETMTNLLAVATVNAEAFERIESLNRDLGVEIARAAELNRSLETQKAEILRLQERLLGENRYLKEELRGECDFTPIIGAAHGLKSVMEMVERAAPSEATVLVLGETGTGKELVARAIHSNGPRAKGPFIKVNVAALAEGLLQSELFGHEKGAFTGAHERRIGRFELAEGGTIFLDEIGDIPPATQLSLLRVLQEREFERVGGRTTLKADVRVVAATHRDLERAIGEGRFREDLFYRLKVLTIEVPPLRQRVEDIRELAVHFVQKNARKHGKPILGIDEAVIERLKLYAWPGNVRQMENVIEHSVVMSRGETLTVEDIPVELRAPSSSDAVSPAEPGPGTRPYRPVSVRGGPRVERMLEVERDEIIRALEEAGGNKAEAARSLGLKRTTLASKLKKLGLLDPPR